MRKEILQADNLRVVANETVGDEDEDAAREDRQQPRVPLQTESNFTILASETFRTAANGSAIFNGASSVVLTVSLLAKIVLALTAVVTIGTTKYIRDGHGSKSSGEIDLTCKR